MEPTTVILIITLLANLVAIVGGFSNIKRNQGESTRTIVESNTKLESRLTAVETDVKWIKNALPKRASDQHMGLQ